MDQAVMALPQNRAFLNNTHWAQATVNRIPHSKGKGSTINISQLKPLFTGHAILGDFITACQAYSTEEWVDLLLRSIDINPLGLSHDDKLACLTMLIPFVQKDMPMGKVKLRI